MSDHHHQVLVLQVFSRRLSMLIIQSALIVMMANLMAHGTRIARDTQPRPSWTLDDDSWNQWWSYSGVSGPSYWGLLNSDWFMCEKGRRQSPIDLNTKALVYDPHLAPLRADNNLISGVLYNDGHSIVFNSSMGALNRFAWLREQKTRQQQQRTESKHEPSSLLGSLPVAETSLNETAQASNHLISRRDSRLSDENTNSIFTPDERSSQFQLVDSNAGFVIEASGGGSETVVSGPADGTVRQHDNGQVPMLMRDLSNSIDLSISESDGLQSKPAAPDVVERGLNGQQEISDSFDEIGDQTGSDSASSIIQGFPNTNPVHFTGANSAYSYRFEALQLKFGPGTTGLEPGSSSSHASSSRQFDGSEHQIDGRAFAAELQLFAYNWQLYKSYDESLTRPYGLLGISILVNTISPSSDTSNDSLETPTNKIATDQQSSSPSLESSSLSSSSSPPGAETRANKTIKTQPAMNEQLERLLVSATNSLSHRGAFTPIRDLNLSALLPETDQFVTYEGSLTQPGCHESVTWLILNRPLYISKQILDKLRSISADELSAANPTGTLIAGNTRPTQPINNRPIRTNIRPPSSMSPSGQPNKPLQEVCPRLWTRYEYT
uniref:Carbonic anhydrase-related protein 10 n=1 Tax=Aceria tosichella TaxID=561515 RepID=A0A6G1S9A2_9ACAR